MNPDYTAETITWTLIDSNGNVVTFKVSPGRVLVQDGDECRGVDKEKGRRFWKEYMDKGFRVQNKCVDHDMKKFYATKRKEESAKEMMDAYLSSYKEQYAKKAYEEAMERYALEA